MTTLPPKPQLPAHLRAQDAAFRRANRAINRAIRTGVADEGLVQEVQSALFGVVRRTEDQLAAEQAYNREAREYNAAVREHNAAAQRAERERTAAAERTKLRANLCPTCHCQHAGECW